MNTKSILDLIDESDWKFNNMVEKIDTKNTQIETLNKTYNYFANSIYFYLDWFYDGEQAESN